MSISRRTSRTVRYVGVASAAAALALGVAGTASACSITEFAPSISCDTQTGTGKIVVNDQDRSGTEVNITVVSGGKTVAEKDSVAGTAAGVPVTFTGIPWTEGAEYTIHVVQTRSGSFVGDKTVTAEGACATPTKDSPTPTPSDSSSAPAAPTSAPPSTSAPSPAESSAAAVADTNSPAPSPSGNLAETGGSSATPVIAGVAAALVVAGGGTVFFLRRRTPAARH